MGITEVVQPQDDDEQEPEQHDVDPGEVEPEQEGDENPTGETPADHSQEPAPEDADEEAVVVTLEGEEPDATESEAAGAPQWVKDLRKEHRATVRELRELKAEKAAAAQVVQPQTQALGAKPTLAECDYDEEAFTAKLEAWHTRKAEIDARERDARAERERQETEWKAKVEGHQKAAAALRVPDYEEAADVVRGQFSDLQQAILLEADNSALLAYAIGKRPAKAKELASISNPVKFAMALAKLETQVKTQPKKTAPPPETRVRASAPVSGTVDSKLAKLMEEADRTGDRTKVAAYHRERARQAA